MMVVLVVAWNIYPDKTGGIEVFNYHFIKWLYSQDDVSPTLVTGIDSTVPKGINTKRYNVKLRRFGNLANIIAIFRACISLKGKNKVIYLSFSKSSWKIWVGYSIVASILRIPYIIYIHGGGMYPWKHEKLMRKVFCNAQRIFCVSPEQKKEYERRTNKSIEILAPIVPFLDYERDRSILDLNYGISNKSFVFLYLGSIRKIKGTDVLIKAFISLEKLIVENDIHLILVGGGDSSKYESLYKKTSCANNIHFVGKVSNEDVGKYYSLADCFILPSRVEGMPVALIEALHNKLPVIVSDLPTIPSILVSGESCLRFPTQDYLELGNQMKIIYSDGKLHDRIAEGGHNVYRENWQGNGTFRTLLSAIKNAAGSSK